MRCSFSSVTKGGPISKSSDAICRKEDVLGEPGFDTKDRKGYGEDRETCYTGFALGDLVVSGVSPS
jgi:hypothetical protein